MHTKHVLILTLIFLLISACGTVRPTPSENTHTTVVVRDSIRWHDSTLYVQVPVESYVDVVPVYDTLKLESTLAKSISYVDTTTHTLKGRLEQVGNVETVVKWKERVVTEYRDSVSIKEIPVEVEVIKTKVPSWCWWLLVFNVLVLLVFAVRMYLKFKV